MLDSGTGVEVPTSTLAVHALLPRQSPVLETTYGLYGMTAYPTFARPFPVIEVATHLDPSCLTVRGIELRVVDRLKIPHAMRISTEFLLKKLHTDTDYEVGISQGSYFAYVLLALQCTKTKARCSDNENSAPPFPPMNMKQ